jgi:putative two-component system response regulator
MEGATVAQILIADDRGEDRQLLRFILETMGHDVIEASDGEQAFELACAHNPDLILSDILMPRLDGFGLCRRLQQDPGRRHIPFVFVTATYGEPRYRRFAEDVGAVRLLLKPYEAEQMRVLVGEVLDNAVRLDATQRFRRLPETDFHMRHAEAVCAKLEEKVRELEEANELLRASEMHTRELFAAVIQTISKIVEYRDPYTIGHERRVAQLAATIAQEIGLEESRVEGVRVGGYLHDVGKIAAPAEILTKPTQLTDNEFAIVKTHALIGHDILAGIPFPWPVAEMTWQHHERMDGSGYPRGLVGEAILLEARILAVADVVEAMSSHRPYRPGLGLDTALAEIERGGGSAYDQVIADACLKLFREGRFTFT